MGSEPLIDTIRGDIMNLKIIKQTIDKLSLSDYKTKQLYKATNKQLRASEHELKRIKRYAQQIKDLTSEANHA